MLVVQFCDHLPPYRQSLIYARAGVELDRSPVAAAALARIGELYAIEMAIRGRGRERTVIIIANARGFCERDCFCSGTVFRGAVCRQKQAGERCG